MTRKRSRYPVLLVLYKSSRKQTNLYLTGPAVVSRADVRLAVVLGDTFECFVAVWISLRVTPATGSGANLVAGLGGPNELQT